MYNIVVDIHSILRWLLAFSLVLTIVYAVYAKSKSLSFNTTGKLSLVSFNLTNLQFLVGLLLYFISPKVIFSSQAMKAPLTRFFLVEHVTGMLIGIILISIGYSAAKKATSDSIKHKKILIFYTLGLLIILASVPWPFYNMGTGWL